MLPEHGTVFLQGFLHPLAISAQPQLTVDNLGVFMQIDTTVTEIRRKILRQQAAACLDAPRGIVHDIEGIERPARPAFLLQLAPAADTVGRTVEDLGGVGIVFHRRSRLRRGVMQLLICVRHSAYAPGNIPAQTGFAAPGAHRLQKCTDRNHEFLRESEISADGKQQLRARPDAQRRERDTKQRQKICRREYAQIKHAPVLAKLSGQQSGGRVYHREQNTGSGGHIHGNAEDHACRRAAQRTARTAEYEQDEHRERSADRERVKQQEVIHAHEQTREQKHR